MMPGRGNRLTLEYPASDNRSLKHTGRRLAVLDWLSPVGHNDDWVRAIVLPATDIAFHPSKRYDYSWVEFLPKSNSTLLTGLIQRLTFEMDSLYF